MSLIVMVLPEDRSVMEVITAPMTTKAIAIVPIVIALAPCHSWKTQTPIIELPMS